MIELQGLQKVINSTPVIDIPVLEVGAGEIVALVGPAASGKRALLDLLIGKTRPTAGMVRLAGIDPYQERGRVSHVFGVLFDEDAVYKHLSPLANLEFHARLYGLPKARAREALAQVGLGDQANVNSDKLSSSLLRRLAFGRAMLHAPQILLLFEPFQRCDQATIGLMHSLLRSMAKKRKAILTLADDRINLDPICNTVYLLNQGRIAEEHQAQEEGGESFPFKIPARMEEKTVVLLNPADVLYAYADQGRAFVVTTDGELPTQFTLTELEDRLQRSGFFRAHRSYLVNLQHVKEVIPFTRNSFSLRLNDPEGTQIPLSKSSAGELSELLGY
jgi:ABC-2 type transport system ATP-binding protein